jgi:hypothetical protein
MHDAALLVWLSLHSFTMHACAGVDKAVVVTTCQLQLHSALLQQSAVTRWGVCARCVSQHAYQLLHAPVYTATMHNALL